MYNIKMDLNLKQQLIELEQGSKLKLEETGLHIDRDYRITILNRGQRDFVRKTKIIKDTFSFYTTKGIMEYDLLDYCPYFLDVNTDEKITYDGTEIDMTSMSKLSDEYGENWKTATTGTPEECYLKEERYLGLYVPPDSVKEVKVAALIRPIDMVKDSDYPFNGVATHYEFQRAPLLYALWQINNLPAGDRDRADRYKIEYNDMIKMATFEPDTEKGYYPSLTPMIYNRNRRR